MQYLILIAIDAVIVVLLIVMLMRYGRSGTTLQKQDLLRLEHLKSSLEKSMNDSARTSQELIQAFEGKISSLAGTLEQVEQEERILRQHLEKARDLRASLSRQGGRDQDDVDDPYRKAADLAAHGAGAEEIRAKSGLSLPEIKLIRDLSKRKPS